MANFGSFSLLLHEGDPGVLVGRRRRRGQDGELALVADHLAHALEHHLGQAVALGLVEEQGAGRGGDVGIVGDDLHALLLGALQRRRDRIGVVARDGDHVDLLRDEVVDELDLRLGGRLRGRLLDDLAADLALGFLGAGLGDLEIGIGVELGQEADRHRRSGAVRPRRRRRNRAVPTARAAIVKMLRCMMRLLRCRRYVRSFGRWLWPPAARPNSGRRHGAAPSGARSTA